MIQSVGRAAAILSALGSGTPRMAVTEIADRVGLARDDLARAVVDAARSISRDLVAGRGVTALS